MIDAATDSRTPAVQQLAFPGSSYLASGTYDPQTQILTVSFKSGGGCQHQGVPQQVIDWLESQGGSYYRRALYGRYDAQNL